VEGGPIDLSDVDDLAEVTMSIHAETEGPRSNAGYARDLCALDEADSPGLCRTEYPGDCERRWRQLSKDVRLPFVSGPGIGPGGQVEDWNRYRRQHNGSLSTICSREESN